ncbi:MAG: hypothetical protein K6F33_00060, partial [Bacteroidales bacterium]|nr:hypothetical protein [Bacteroidales bacterium]
MKQLILMLIFATAMLSACGKDSDIPIEPPSYTNAQQNTDNTTYEQQETIATEMTEKLIITIAGKSMEANFANNSSAQALADALKKAPITYRAHDYGGFEKVGDIGLSLPQNNENITTEPGDIILYQGHNL